MKRVLRIAGTFLLLFTVLNLLPVIANAVQDDDKCPRSNTGAHEWEIISIIQPTCTTKGSIHKRCKLCRQEADEEIDALGHDWENWTQSKAATCDEPGEETRICSRHEHGGCDAIETRPIPALGHQWDEGTVTVQPSCAADGVKTYTCQRDHSHTYQEAIPKTAHTPVSVPGKPATCTETGLTEGQKCSVCGAVLKAQETIPALGHKPVSIAGKAATCTETGLTEGQKCSVCGAVLKAQETIPALGHKPVSIPGKAATCTESGLTEGQKCSVCGTVLTAQQEIPAHGHDYESAVTKKPQGFTPGVRTYTCKHDPSHTYTEEIAPAESLFSKLRNLPPAAAGMGPDPLKITKQPQGGGIRENTNYQNLLMLRVEVEGGVPPYTYEWHYRDITREEQEIEDILGIGAQSQVQAICEEAAEKKKGLADLWLAINKGTTASEDTTGKTVYPLENTEGMETVFNYFDLYDHVIEGEKSPTLKAADGNRYYYVIVRDQLNQEVKSDPVRVNWLLSVLIQPNSVNLASGEYAYFQAMYGTEPYTYSWAYETEPGSYHAVEGETDTAYFPTEDMIGKRMIGIAQDEAGDRVNTIPFLVYSADPLEITSWSEDQVLSEEGSAELYIRYAGGYNLDTTTVEWYLGNVLVNSSSETPSTSSTGYYGRLDESRITVTDIGAYTAVITDEARNTVKKTIYVGNKKLTIKEEPEDVRLPYRESGAKQAPGTARLVVEDGLAPITYSLEKEGSGIVDEKTDENEFEIAEPGLYTILAADSDGASARSRTFRVYDYDLKAYWAPENPKIRSGGNHPDYAVLKGEAYKGTPPYQYRWYKWNQALHTWESSWEVMIPKYLNKGDAVYTEAYDYTAIYQAYVKNEALYNLYRYEPAKFDYTDWKPTQEGKYFYAYVGEPGLYCAGVKDANGAVAFSNFFDVSFIGPEPRIIEQPYGVILSPTEKNTEITLNCRAMAAAREGDAHYGAESNLTYVWEQYKGSGVFEATPDWVVKQNGWAVISRNEGSGYYPLGKLKDHQGYFRCKIFDIGEHGYKEIYTKVVPMKVDFLFRKAKTRVFDFEGKNVEGLRFTFEGGGGPYRVRSITRDGEPYKIDGKYIEISESSKGKVYVDIRKELDLYHMNGSKHVIGYYEPYTYKIELEDHNGQRVWGTFRLAD